MYVACSLNLVLFIASKCLGVDQNQSLGQDLRVEVLHLAENVKKERTENVAPGAIADLGRNTELGVVRLLLTEGIDLLEEEDLVTLEVKVVLQV